MSLATLFHFLCAQHVSDIKQVNCFGSLDGPTFISIKQRDEGNKFGI